LTISATARADSALERVSIGVIGCGGRGRLFCNPDYHVRYVCDPDRERLAEAAKQANVPEARAVTDLRRILDDPEVDAVVVATPDHWHAPAAILACEAGKHVYVEKPASHNFRESQLLVASARRNSVVVQHGTQQRTTPFTADAIQMLHEGVIGDVLVAKAWNIQERRSIGHAQPSDPPSGVNYDMWVGPAEMVPFQKNRFHYDWHWWFNFGTGDLGNDGAHELDYARWGLQADALPTRVVALGGKYFFNDDQQFPDTATCTFEYASTGQANRPRQLVFEMRLWSRNAPLNCDSGVEFLGTKGKMVLSKRGKLIVYGQENETLIDRRDEKPSVWQHFDDFVGAIRNSRRPAADVIEAHRTVALIHLANIAMRTDGALQFDTQHEEFVGDENANRLLTRRYREDGHWAIPSGVTA
jgi:predicted dehydrogenase